MAQIAFRVDLQVRGGDEKPGLRKIDGHTWAIDDQFVLHGKQWTVDAVITRFVDGVPYPAEAQCLLIAGDRDTRSSVIVDADEVLFVE